MSDLDATASRQVAVEMELFFQLQSLVARVRRPLSLRFSIGIDGIWNKAGKIETQE